MKTNRIFITLIGIAFVTLAGGCKAKTEDLIDRTLSDDQTKFSISGNLIINVTTDSDYRIQINDDETVYLDNDFIYRTGKSIYSVTNYTKDEHEFEEFYQKNGTGLTLTQKSGNSYYEAEYTGFVFDKDSFINLFRNTDPIKVNVGEVPYWKLERTLPLSECSYLCFNEFFETYKDSFRVHIENYYDSENYDFVCCRITYLLDGDSMLATYDSLGKPFGYNVYCFTLEDNKFEIRPEKDSFDINAKYEEIKPNIKTSELGLIDNMLNDYEDNQTGSESPKNANTQSLEDEVLMIDEKTTAMYLGEADEKTLCAIWEEFMGFDIDFNTETLIGSGYCTELYESDFAKSVYDLYYNVTIEELADKLKNNSLNESELYAYVHLSETYNIGLYSTDSGVVSYKDLYVLSGHKESEYDELKKSYQALFIGQSLIEETEEATE